jgi:hypothetical protein
MVGTSLCFRPVPRTNGRRIRSITRAKRLRREWSAFCCFPSAVVKGGLEADLEKLEKAMQEKD